MFCPNCGYQNADDDRFCQNCGTALPDAGRFQPTQTESAQQQATSQQTAQQQTAQQNIHQQTAQQAFQQQPYAQPTSGGAVWMLLKQCCSIPAALVAIIAFTASLLFRLPQAFQPPGSFILSSSRMILPPLYGAIDELTPLLDQLYGYISKISIGATLIGLIPGILIAVGLWMVYASAANKAKPGINTNGLMLIKVILIIDLVCACILTLVLELGLMFIIAGFASEYYYRSVAGSLFVVWIFLAVVFTLMIIFYAKAVRTTTVIRDAARYGKLSDRVSLYVAVISYIIGGMTVLRLFTTHNIFSILQGFCSATASIAFGIFLFSYRKLVRAAFQPQAGHMQY